MGHHRARTHQDHGSGASLALPCQREAWRSPLTPPCRCGLSMTLSTGVALGVSVGRSPVDSIGGKWLDFAAISH